MKLFQPIRTPNSTANHNAVMECVFVTARETGSGFTILEEMID